MGEELKRTKSIGIQAVPKLERKNARIQVRMKTKDKGVVVFCFVFLFFVF